MEGIHSTIKRLRKMKGLTAEQVADRIGVSRATYYKYESKDINKLPSSILPPLAELFGVSIAYLYGIKSDDLEPAENEKMAGRIPVYGSIPAGVPVEAIEDIDGHVELSQNMKNDYHRYIALRVKGDSMYPKYMDGDIVIVQLQEDCETGQDAVVLVDGQDATLKKVIRKEDGTIILQPLNPAFEVAIYSPSEVRSLPISIVGVVKELRRQVL